MSTDLETDDAIRLFGQGTEHQDRRPTCATQPTCDRKAVFTRHHDVEDHEIEASAMQALVQLGRVARSRGPETVLFQVADQSVADVAMVIDDQDMGTWVA
jgi:hypothetical protein